MKFTKIAVVLVASLLASPAFSADKLTIMLDWFVNPDHGPIIIAQEKGYFAEQNLDVKIIAPADPADPPKLVAAGQADLAVTYQPQLHLHAHEGLPLKRVGTLIATPLTCLMVVDDGPIKTIADLKGKKIGTSVGGIEDAVLGRMLGNYGLTMDDITLINVNWSLSPSLMSGQVDAVQVYRNFELTQMEIEGVKGRCFYVEEEGIPPYDELIYIANSDSMDKDKLKRFMAATEKAVQYMVNHPQQSWQIFANSSTELQDELNERAWFDTLPRFALRPTAMDHGRYATYETFLFDAKMIDSIKPVSDFAIDITAPEENN